MSPKTKFAEGEKVLCFHGPLIYEAKCLKVQVKEKQSKYFIHYAGWNKNWDEWVPESRVLKLNDQNIQRQKDLQKAHEVQQKGKKAKKLSMEKKKPSTQSKESGNTSSVGDDDSRSSTPVPEKPPSKRSASSLGSNTKEESEHKKKKTKPVEPSVEPWRMLKDIMTCLQEEVFSSTVEIRIKLPDELKPVLVDDWDLITRQKKLPNLPARVTVDTILSDFLKARTNTKSASNKETAVAEIVSGLKEYFNVMLGSQLLYKFERPQYARILKDYPNELRTNIYGFVHMTRLFVRLGQMLVYTQLDDKSIALLNIHINDFMKFMVKNMDTYYSVHEYGIAPPEYLRQTL